MVLCLRQFLLTERGDFEERLKEATEIFSTIWYPSLIQTALSRDEKKWRAVRLFDSLPPAIAKFIKTEDSPLGPVIEINWDAVESSALQAFNTMLRSDADFLAAEIAGIPIVHGCRILRDSHRPAAPYTGIGKIFRMSRQAVMAHPCASGKYKAEEGETGGDPFCPMKDPNH
jgi:hypothetical protein